MSLPSCELLFITLGSPLLVGIYQNGELKQSISSDKPNSEAITELLAELKKQYKITKIIYTNGPGSFMGLKVAFVALSVFAGVYGCEFGAVSGFSLNGNAPIAAKKGFSFVLNDDKISLEPVLGVSASLPKSLKNLSISTDVLPNYVLEAV